MIPHKLAAKLFFKRETLQKRIRAFCSENVSFWTLIFQIFINQNLNTTCHYIKNVLRNHACRHVLKEQHKVQINSSHRKGDLFVSLNTVKCQGSKKRGTSWFPWGKGPAEEQQCQWLPALVITYVLLSPAPRKINYKGCSWQAVTPVTEQGSSWLCFSSQHSSTMMALLWKAKSIMWSLDVKEKGALHDWVPDTEQGSSAMVSDKPKYSNEVTAQQWGRA